MPLLLGFFSTSKVTSTIDSGGAVVFFNLGYEFHSMSITLKIEHVSFLPTVVLVHEHVTILAIYALWPSIGACIGPLVWILGWKYQTPSQSPSLTIQLLYHHLYHYCFNITTHQIHRTRPLHRHVEIASACTCFCIYPCYYFTPTFVFSSTSARHIFSSHASYAHSFHML